MFRVYKILNSSVKIQNSISIRQVDEIINLFHLFAYKILFIRSKGKIQCAAKFIYIYTFRRIIVGISTDFEDLNTALNFQQSCDL